MRSSVLPARVVFLVFWGNLVLWTMPRLLSGPLRPVPVAHLCWTLSMVVVALAVRRSSIGTASERWTVTAGLLAGLVIGLITGIHGARSGLVGAAIVALVALGLEGPVALVMITLVGLGLHARLIGDGTRPADRPPWAHGPAANRPYNPSAILNPADTAQRELAIAYGRSLWPGDLPPPNDERRLSDPGGAGPGPIARVWAEPASYLNDPLDLLPAELGRGTVGRIVARIWVEPGDSTGYAPLDLPSGVSWLWVDSLRAGEQAVRGAIIPENGSPVRIRVVRWIRGVPPRFGAPPDWINHATARWVYGPRGESLAVSCAFLAECRLEPAAAAP